MLDAHADAPALVLLQGAVPSLQSAMASARINYWTASSLLLAPAFLRCCTVGAIHTAPGPRVVLLDVLGWGWLGEVTLLEGRGEGKGRVWGCRGAWEGA